MLGAAGALGIVLVVHGYCGGVTGASGPTSAVNPGPLRVSPQDTAHLVEIDPRTGTGPTKSLTSGFSVQVIPGATTVTLGVSTAGSSRAQTATYALGDRVSFVQTTFGDHSWNLGDGLVGTEGSGSIVA